MSNDVVSYWISDLAEDLNETMVEKIKKKLSAIQIDNATDSAKNAHIITYLVYVDEDEIKEGVDRQASRNA